MYLSPKYVRRACASVIDRTVGSLVEMIGGLCPTTGGKPADVDVEGQITVGERPVRFPAVVDPHSVDDPVGVEVLRTAVAQLLVGLRLEFAADLIRSAPQEGMVPLEPRPSAAPARHHPVQDAHRYGAAFLRSWARNASFVNHRSLVNRGVMSRRGCMRLPPPRRTCLVFPEDLNEVSGIVPDQNVGPLVRLGGKGAQGDLHTSISQSVQGPLEVLDDHADLEDAVDEHGLPAGGNAAQGRRLIVRDQFDDQSTTL